MKLKDYIKGVHHVGVVVESVEEAFKSYQRLGFKVDGNLMSDEVKKVKIGMVSLDGYSLELLEPLDESSPIAHFLRRGGGPNHLCYEVEKFDEFFEYIKSNEDGFIIKEPEKSVFEGKRVFFWGTKQKEIIEFKEI